MKEEEKLEKCIKELKKPIENRDHSFIIDYIKTLESFMNLIQERNEDTEDIIIKISKIMNLQTNITNDLIIQYGERGNFFYIILKGTIAILVPKFTEYYMNEEDFLMHLFKLKRYNQNELIIRCLRQNSLFFSIPNENFDDFLKNFQNKSYSLLYKKKIINEAKELYKYINSEEYINNKDKKINITPEKYISLLDIDDNVKKNTEKLKYMNNLKLEFEKSDEDKKLVMIPNFEIVSEFNTGYSFGELALEHLNKKRMATIIALTDCDFAVMNKMEYNELIKESYSKSKNKFFNLIYTYKIFDYITHSSFEKKYYNHFQYLKIKKNSILFNEGDECDEVYFLLDGEFELYVDKNIEEVNKIILELKNKIDNLKKIIIKENSNYMYNNSNIKNKTYQKIKNNLNEFFNKFENEIKLEEIEYLIKHKELINKKKYLGSNFNKIISDKKRVKLGIYKSRQILGLNDIINRQNGNNKCYFNCKCSSFFGELYYIDYKKFCSIYENEENVKLFTSELLYQNLYYIIGRLLLHKKYIYEYAKKKQSDFMEYKTQNINNFVNDYTSKNSRNAINIMKPQFKINNLINKKKILNSRIYNFIQSDLNSLTNESKSINFKSESLNVKKDININILKNINERKKYGSYYGAFTDKKEKEKYNDYNDNYNYNYNSQNNNSTDYIKSKIESYILSKKNDKIGLNKSNSNFSKSHKIIKFNSKNLLISKTKSEENDTLSPEEKVNNPVLVINDKKVEINENFRENYNYKKNYKILIKSMYLQNKKMRNIIKSKELKNIALFGDFSESIEVKNNYKNLFRKNKNLLIYRNIVKNIISKNHSKDKNGNNNNFSYTSNRFNDSARFLTYNISDLNGNNQKEIKLKVNESINLIKNKNDKKSEFKFNLNNKISNKTSYTTKSLSFRKYKKLNSENISFFSTFNKSPTLKKNSFLKKNYYISHLYKKDYINKAKYLPLIKDKNEKNNIP